MRKLTRRFIINSIENLELSKPIRYERYYINNELRIQKKDIKYQKEKLDIYNNVIEKVEISENEFCELKKKSYSKIIRNSYLYLKDPRVSIKEYLDKYDGLYRVEVKFTSENEEKEYVKECWMGKEITYSPLAFDKDLSKLSEEEFRAELTRFKGEN